MSDTSADHAAPKPRRPLGCLLAAACPALAAAITLPMFWLNEAGVRIPAIAAAVAGLGFLLALFGPMLSMILLGDQTRSAGARVAITLAAGALGLALYAALIACGGFITNLFVQMR